MRGEAHATFNWIETTTLSGKSHTEENPRLASPSFCPTLDPDTTSCSVLCLRKGIYAAPRTRCLARRQRPPPRSPCRTSGPLIPTTSLSCVDQICPCRIVVLRSQAPREADF